MRKPNRRASVKPRPVHYLIQREFMMDAWKGFPTVFTYLTYDQQVELHRFYATTKDLNGEEAIAHRKEVSSKEPSLPNRAGKLYARVFRIAEIVQQYIESQPELKPKPVREKVRTRVASSKLNIRISALAKPEPDIDKLAALLLDVARDMAREQETQDREAA
jgi:hypothetical protein